MGQSATARRKKPAKRINSLGYLGLKQQLINRGYEGEIAWAENVGACKSADDFAREHAFVVCNSGMKEQIARPIFERCWRHLSSGRKLNAGVFGNMPKIAAMQWVYDSREDLFRQYQEMKSTAKKLEFMQTLPFIGPITVYHLAKNFGVDCCKPDRHLVRIAAAGGETPEEFCKRLARATGDRIATVDMVIWRAANLGIL